MKKIIAVFALTGLVSALCSCSNKSIGMGEHKYERVHVDTYHYSGCFTVEKWHDDSVGVEVKTKEVGSVFLSEGTYFLISKECPFCASLTEKGGEG